MDRIDIQVDGAFLTRPHGRPCGGVFRNYKAPRRRARTRTPTLLRRTHLLERADGPRHIRKFCVLTRVRNDPGKPVTQARLSARGYDAILKRIRTTRAEFRMSSPVLVAR